MADEKKINEVEQVEGEVAEVSAPIEKKAKEKPVEKKPNWFVRVWRKIVKLCKDTAGELKKVVWTPKAEVFKSFKLVIATVVAIGVAIAIIDLAASFIINGFAGLIG